MHKGDGDDDGDRLVCFVIHSSHSFHALSLHPFFLNFRLRFFWCYNIFLAARYFAPSLGFSYFIGSNSVICSDGGMTLRKRKWRSSRRNVPGQGRAGCGHEVDEREEQQPEEEQGQGYAGRTLTGAGR